MGLAPKKVRDFWGGARLRESGLGREILSEARLPLAKSLAMICSAPFGQNGLGSMTPLAGRPVSLWRSQMQSIDSERKAWRC